MTDHQTDAVVDFSESLNQLASHTSELQDVVERIIQALTQHGVQLSIDIDAMVQDVQNNVSTVQQKSRGVVAQIDRLKELLRTIALITSSLELDQVLAEVMDTVIQLTGAERAYLMLRDKQTDELKTRTARNWDRESLSEQDVVFSRSVINLALDEKQPIVTTNAQMDARFQEMKSVVQHGLRSILCIPLVIHGRVVGVLYADNRIEKGVFGQSDIPLLTAFGVQAAIAIENARLFEKVKDDLQEAKRELEHLQIQIDRRKVAQQVSEITESDYFERLSIAARNIRKTREHHHQSQTDDE